MLDSELRRGRGSYRAGIVKRLRYSWAARTISGDAIRVKVGGEWQVHA